MSGHAEIGRTGEAVVAGADHDRVEKVHSPHALPKRKLVTLHPGSLDDRTPLSHFRFQLRLQSGRRRLFKRDRFGAEACKPLDDLWIRSEERRVGKESRSLWSPKH